MSRFTITAAEMVAHGLPPLEISCSGEVFVRTFIDAKTPLYYCGPPGGPDHLSVQVLRHSSGDTPFSLQDEVRKNDRAGRNFVLGVAGEFVVGGEKWPVLSWSVKETPWLDACATTFVSIAALDASVVINFTAWHDPARGLVTHASQNRILESLKLTPRGSRAAPGGRGTLR